MKDVRNELVAHVDWRYVPASGALSLDRLFFGYVLQEKSTLIDDHEATYKLRLGVVALVAKNKLFDEDGQKLLQPGSLVLSVYYVALALFLKFGICPKFAAEEFDCI